MQDNNNNTDNDYEQWKKELEDLCTVACIHCGKRSVKFSRNIFNDQRMVLFQCPNCNGYTEITSSFCISGYIY
jgi:ssDNA-binding Zn-finger/Zn-ribbon topoisomerase 1